MPIDPSIALQVQPIQMPNQLDTAVKAMTLKDLSQKSQIQDRAIADDQAVRVAFRNNMVQGPSGPVLNRQAALSQLAQTSPQKAMDYQKLFKDQDLDKLSYETKAMSTLFSQVRDDQTYQTAVQRARQMGITNADKLPNEYNPTFVGNLNLHLLNGEEQLKQANADRTFQQKDAELGLKHEENSLKREQLAQDRHDKFVTHAEDTVKSVRGDDLSKMNLIRIGAAEGGKSIVDRYRGREDEMPMKDIHMLAAERAKAAIGGIPGEAEIEAQIPANLKTKWAEYREKGTGGPVPANAGEYVRNMDYGFRDLEKVARDQLEQRQKGAVSDPRLSPAEKNRISKSGLPPRVYEETVNITGPDGKTREIPKSMEAAAMADLARRKAQASK